MFIYCGNRVGKKTVNKYLLVFALNFLDFSIFFSCFFVNDFLVFFSKMLLESLLTHLVSKDYELIGRLAMHQSFVSTPPVE